MRDHLALGDRLLGAGRAEDAMAEYQVALRQRGDQPEVLLRLAHGYSHLDRLDETNDYYSRLLAVDSSYVDQAVADYLAMARRALVGNDRARFARALEQLETVRPGAVPDELALPFARYYYELGEHTSALPLYLAALAVQPEVVEPTVDYELGRIYYELNECGRALDHFRAFLATRPSGEVRRDSRWHAGQCAFRLAQKDRLAGRPTEALAGFEEVIGLGAPQTLLDDAWFERGEILFSLGEYDEAVRSYQRVLELNPSRVGRKVRQAEDRIRSIRYRSTEEERE
ncbi:MAG: tetratricopeptide repeat protein [Gemmatimonadota bacterium]|nr:MAG: tetratricopeptide repeat protein [Gemmatimonadota bacterium]